MPTYPMNSDHSGCIPLGRSATCRTLLRRLARDSHDVCTRLLAANGVPPAAEVGDRGRVQRGSSGPNLQKNGEKMMVQRGKSMETIGK